MGKVEVMSKYYRDRRKQNNKSEWERTKEENNTSKKGKWIE